MELFPFGNIREMTNGSPDSNRYFFNLLTYRSVHFPPFVFIEKYYDKKKIISEK